MKKSSKEVTVIGMDLGDKSSRLCGLDGAGQVVWEGSVATTKKGLEQRFSGLRRCRVAMEVGTHSPWISRLLRKLGFEVVVANAGQLLLISQSSRKTDQVDARMLAKVALALPELLRPVQHRGEQAQLDLMSVRVRAQLVEARTRLVNSARGLAKAVGERLPACDTRQWEQERIENLALPEPVKEALRPLLEQVEQLNESIAKIDAKLEQIARDRYPETQLLTQVHGVGNLIALTFVLTLEDAGRFAKSRDVGCYVGLRPKHSQSGESQPELRITKEGDAYLRRLLVQGAHTLLRRRAPDSDLKRFGQKLSGRGGKNQKKRAVVAVARKLGILLHRLWSTGEVYDPLHNHRAALPAAA